LTRRVWAKAPAKAKAKAPAAAKAPANPPRPAPISEHVEQREFVSEFRKAFPSVRIFAIPNGEARSRTTGARLKAEGVSAGVPDLFVPAWSLWVEMKRASGGRVSPEQADWHAYLVSIGHHVIVARGQHDAWEKIKQLMEIP
jgi:hypothetical protein